MGLHKNKRLQRPGLPELIGTLLIAAVVVTAILWIDQFARPGWRTTGGRVLNASSRMIHYNAQDTQERVELSYEYSVGGIRYVGHWTGFWPATNSPNALPMSELTKLHRDGASLTVYFDPTAPNRSRLHEVPNGSHYIYGAVLIGLTACALFYCVRVYPAWKLHQSQSLLKTATLGMRRRGKASPARHL